MPEVSDFSREVILAANGLSPALVPLLGGGGITAVSLGRPDPALERACAGARIRVVPGLPFRALPEIAAAPHSAPVVFTGGLPPGVTRLNAGSDGAIAGPTGAVWVDANVHWVTWLRALYPGRPALLGEAANGKGAPMEALDLALAETRITGGNRILALSPPARAALLKGDAKALAAWKTLGRTAGWLRDHAALFGRPVDPAVTQLVDRREETPELANLLLRNNVSPRLVDAANPPAPDAARIRVLVAAGIHQPAAEVASRILAHASAGATVVVDAAREHAWWKAAALRQSRADEDRLIYTLGSGRLVAYNDAIADPGGFALDVIDLVSQKRRAVRIWDAPAAVAMMTAGPEAGSLRARAVMPLVNYGSPVPGEVMAQVHGAFSRAVLLRPEGPPRDLSVTHRGGGTAVFLPGLRRVAAILFT